MSSSVESAHPSTTTISTEEISNPQIPKSQNSSNQEKHSTTSNTSNSNTETSSSIPSYSTSSSSSSADSSTIPTKPNPYSFVRATKLQLKTGKTIGNSIKRPNESSQSKSQSATISFESDSAKRLKSSSADQPTAAAVSASASSNSAESLYRFTKAEIGYRNSLFQRESSIIDQRISLSHRERIDKYNENLSKLSEHHDIPRVGPG